MGAMAPPPHWIPEDDVLLRNAVEAGASLECLAKGAVQFSRRFTVQELHDRWFSLLYDPVISVEASTRMIEVERSAFPNQIRPNKLDVGIACSSGKRKAESVRKCYYAMRKRICSEPYELMAINLLPGPGYSNFGDCNELLSADCRTGNPVLNNLGMEGQDFDIRPEFGPHGKGVVPSFTSVHNHGQDVPHNLSYPYEENIALIGDCSEVPGFGQSKELPLCSFFEAEGLVTEGNTCSQFGGLPFNNFESSSPLPQMPIWQASQEIAGLPIQIGEIDQPTSTEDYLAELSSTLFDLADTDQPLFMDNDAKDALEKSYLDGLSSLLLDSPNQCELPSDGLGEATVAIDGHVIDTSGANNERSESQGHTIKNFGPEYRNGVITCTLNTEDPEIPSNDDVFLPFRCPSPTNSSGVHWRLHEPGYLTSSSSLNDFSSTPKTYGGPLTIKNNSCAPSGMIGSSHPSDMGLRNSIGDPGVKFELPKSNIEHAALRSARNNECPNRFSSENLNANNFVSGTVKGGAMEIEQEKNIDCNPDELKSGLDILQSLQKNPKAEILNNGSSNADLSSQQTIIPKPSDQSLLSDQDDCWSENEFDVPYFSDVEAMILDKDLSPDEFDLYNSREAQRYKHEETKRTIIRLEQAADAFTQRTIAGQDAFAVLYSRCSKYFIKRPEVLLGRATDDIKVDIDLGREKNGGKISRKQAIVKMDMLGLFHLKNLGKSSIYVNGKAVAPGQSLNLTSGCLIEVRGLTFIFETNHKSIKQYVDSIGGGGVLVEGDKPSDRR